MAVEPEILSLLIPIGHDPHLLPFSQPVILRSISYLVLGLPSDHFPRINPTKILYISLILAIWPAHCGPLNFTILKILGNLYNS